MLRVVDHVVRVLFVFFFFFFNDTATTEIYTLSLHDALPIWLMSLVGSAAGQPQYRRFTRTPYYTEIGRASCRGRGEISVVAVLLKKKTDSMNFFDPNILGSRIIFCAFSHAGTGY